MSNITHEVFSVTVTKTNSVVCTYNLVLVLVLVDCRAGAGREKKRGDLCEAIYVAVPFVIAVSTHPHVSPRNGAF